MQEKKSVRLSFVWVGVRMCVCVCANMCVLVLLHINRDRDGHLICVSLHRGWTVCGKKRPARSRFELCAICAPKMAVHICVAASVTAYQTTYPVGWCTKNDLSSVYVQFLASPCAVCDVGHSYIRHHQHQICRIRLHVCVCVRAMRRGHIVIHWTFERNVFRVHQLIRTINNREIGRSSQFGHFVDWPNSFQRIHPNSNVIRLSSTPAAHAFRTQTHRTDFFHLFLSFSSATFTKNIIWFECETHNRKHLLCVHIILALVADRIDVIVWLKEAHYICVICTNCDSSGNNHKHAYTRSAHTRTHLTFFFLVSDPVDCVFAVDVRCSCWSVSFSLLSERFIRKFANSSLFDNSITK